MHVDTMLTIAKYVLVSKICKSKLYSKVLLFFYFQLPKITCYTCV